jgi:putative DNA primase/helicase
MNATHQFQQAMTNAGLTPPDTIHGDGQLHRFSTDGKPGHKNGWYFLHTDATPWGQAGSWDVNGGEPVCHWCAKSDTSMTQAERDTQQAQQRAMKAQREFDVNQRQQTAAIEAAQRLAAAAPCTQHSYLTAKGVQGHGVKVDAAGVLIVPMRDTAGQLRSLQSIALTGDKRFLFGGQIKGCYHAMGKPAGLLIVCEGYATGASIHESTGYAVAVAFNAGNLGPVALALRAKYPGLKIVIAADDDHLTDGNPGLTKATAAALSVGGFVAKPQFPATRGGKDTDFNDLHQLAGAAAVKACISEIEEFA